MPADNSFMPGEQSGIPNNILSDLLLKKQSMPQQPNVTVDDVNNYNFGLSPEEEMAYNESQQKFQPQKEVLANSTYYPSMNENTAVGTYSGRIVGSNTLFAPNGGLVPIGMFDARDAAIQKAAMAKAQDVEDWKKKNVKAPVSNLTNINEKLTKDYFEFEDNAWKDALKSAKGDANKARFIIENNNEYQSRKKGFYDAAKMGDAVVQKIEAIKASKDKGQFVSKELEDAIGNMYSIADSKSEGFKNNYDNLMKLDTVKDMNDVVNDIKKNLDMQVEAWANINQNDPDGIIEVSGTKKFYTQQAKEAARKQAYSHYGLGPNGEGGNSYANKGTIDSIIDQALGAIQETADKNWQNKNKDNSGLDDVITEDNIATEPDIFNIENQVKKGMGEGEDKDVRVEQIVGSNGQYLKKSIPLKLISGTKVWDISGGNKNFINSKTTGAKDAVVTKSTNVDVIDAPGTSDNGRLMTIQYKERHPNAKTKKTPMAILEYEEPLFEEEEVIGKKDAAGKPLKKKVPSVDSDGNPVTKKVTAMVPLESVRNSVEKRKGGKYHSGINVDLANEKASENKKDDNDYTMLKTGGKTKTAVEGGKAKIFMQHKGKNYSQQEVEDIAKQYGYTAQEYVDWLKKQK